ncbi:MAG: hypothetical protein GTN78_01605, partial [Gemmatimonadales bacterium]|nr:hypothetical protein [Gemmatimonadales bacterium]
MVGSRQVAWVLLGLLAVGIVAVGCQKSREPEKPPVEIVAYYPLNEGHLFIAEYLEEL